MGRKKLLNRLLRPIGFAAVRLTPHGPETDVPDAALRFKKLKVPRLSADLDHVVQRGPFSGMRLPSAGAWADHDLFSKLIGAYEKDLFASLEAEISCAPDVVVNIGASEGYYAIGLQQRLPDATTLTFDIDKGSRETLTACAADNGVSVEVLEAFEFSDPLRNAPVLANAKRPFFVIDCEGCEAGLVDMPSAVLEKSSFLIELHDVFVPGLTDQLSNLFRATHDVTLITQSTRQMEEFPELAEFSTILGAVLLDEFRYGQMQWLYVVPK